MKLKKKSRIKEEATFRDSGSVFSNTPGSNVLFLENESQALFVVTGERKQPKPIWLSEAVPRVKTSLCLLTVLRVEMYFSACLRFHTERLLFVDV